jgi:uncharacterized coiled-coil protein SlyX
MIDLVTNPAEIHIHIHLSDEPRLDTLEERIVSVADDLTALNAQVTEFNEDIAAKVAALEAAQGTFTPEGQAAFDALKATVDAGVAAVGDADQDGTPPPPPPTP